MILKSALLDVVALCITRELKWELVIRVLKKLLNPSLGTVAHVGGLYYHSLSIVSKARN